MLERFQKSYPMILTTMAGAVVLAGVAVMISNSVTDTMRRELEKSLNTVLVATHNALTTWSSQHQELAAIAAASPRLAEFSEVLSAGDRQRETLLAAPVQDQIWPLFSMLHEMKGYIGYTIVSRDNIVLSALDEDLVGRSSLLGRQPHFLEATGSGNTAISRPMLLDNQPSDSDDGAVMIVGAPILGEDGKVIAVLVFHIDPYADFVPTLTRSRIGESGETYSFDASGLLVSASRFEDHLTASGLIGPDESAMLNIMARDPWSFSLNGDSENESEKNPTLHQRNAGVQREHKLSTMSEYIDYRGEEVVGVWLWEDEFEMGLVTKVDITQAYSPMRAQQMSIAGFAIVAIGLMTAISVIFALNRRRSLARENRLQQAMKMEALGRMASGIAHEFNNLLLPIVTLTQLTRKQLPEGFDGKRNLDLVLQAAEQGKRIIEQVLDFSRQNPANRKLTRLCEVIVKSVAILRKSAPATARIHFETEDKECVAMANETEIHQLVINLGSNALKSLAPEGGLIGIGVAKTRVEGSEAGTLEGLPPGNYARLTFIDDGCGMDGATREKIFEPFFSARHKEGGTGMGLAIVKAIVEGHNGRIIVDSSEGMGTEFTIYLPLI